MFGVRCEDYVMEGCQLSLSEAVIHQAGQTRGGGEGREISSYLEIRDITPACLHILVLLIRM